MREQGKQDVEQERAKLQAEIKRSASQVARVEATLEAERQKEATSMSTVTVDDASATQAAQARAEAAHWREKASAEELEIQHMKEDLTTVAVENEPAKPEDENSIELKKQLVALAQQNKHLKDEAKTFKHESDVANQKAQKASDEMQEMSDNVEAQLAQAHDAAEEAAIEKAKAVAATEIAKGEVNGVSPDDTQVANSSTPAESDRARDEALSRALTAARAKLEAANQSRWKAKKA